MVTLRFRVGTDRDAIEYGMFQIADVFAALEGMSEGTTEFILGSGNASREQRTALPFAGASLTPIIRKNLMQPFDSLPATSTKEAFIRRRCQPASSAHSSEKRHSLA